MEQINNQTIDDLTSAICALIEAMGMRAENEHRLQRGQSQAYGEDAFNALIEKHNLTGF
jgi:hypothetical protein